MRRCDTIKHGLHRAIVIAVFAPIYLTALFVFGILEGRTGIEETTAEFRELIP